jgi:type IV secretory pathway VirB2 component (pilin)
MQPSRSYVRVLLFACVFSLVSVATYAGTIDFTIFNPNRFGFPGDVLTFQGTITNNSGVDLDSTDFFLNFSGYDFSNVTLDQLLGLTFFSIPNGTTTGTIDLFTFTLSTTAGTGTYPADVILEDVFGDLAGPTTVTVTVSPEPESLALIAAGVLALVGLRRRAKLALPVVLIVLTITTLGAAQVQFCERISRTGRR